jgi:hypothetical protein
MTVQLGVDRATFGEHSILGTSVNSVLGAWAMSQLFTGGHISYVRGVALALRWGRKVLLDNS